MKLAQYLTDKKMNPEQFAAEMGSVSASGIRKWLYGERVPRPDQMRKIAELTGGLVEPNDFILPLTVERLDAVLEKCVSPRCRKPEAAQ